MIEPTNTRTRGPRRGGFTLVEALVGSAILAVAAVGIFWVFRSGNRQASQAAWTSAAQKELRNTLKRIHDELSRASYYTQLTRSEVAYLDPTTGAKFTGTELQEADHRINFDVMVDGTPDAPKEFTPDGTRQDIMFFYQCTPKQTDFAGAAAEEGSAAVCNLYLQGDTLIFQRDRSHDPSGKVVEVFKEIAFHVEKIQTYVEDKADAADPLQGSEITVEITVHHPNPGVFPNARITQATTARVPVGHRGL